MKLRIFLSVVGAALIAACSSSGSSGGGAGNTPSASVSASVSANAPADATAAKAEITTNWEKFFAYTTPRAQAQSLIETGAAMKPALDFAAQLQQSGKVKQAAKVTSISFTSATTATVNYELLNGTQVLLPTAQGKAVLVNGKWVVSKETFCTLVGLGAGGKAVPGC